jgi:hypothetical protein
VRPNQVDDPQSLRGHRSLKSVRSTLGASVRNRACAALDGKPCPSGSFLSKING